MARQAMVALADVHAVERDSLQGLLGPAETCQELVLRWDRFFDQGEYASVMAADFERVRFALLTSAPTDHVGVLCHGDFQFGNLMFTKEGLLTAVIDWELCGLAPAASDLGWVLAFHTPDAWGGLHRESASYLSAQALRSYYEEAAGDVQDVTWFQALAHYKYAVIASLNLRLHRRGKREDPGWEVRGPGALTNMRYAADLLGA
jgi:aminoglycoside phosphotransferase (APT) family kinase protein